MLAYIFWHRPDKGVPAATYESALGRFHDSLAGANCPGFHSSRAWRVSGAPWLGGGAGYEDWYLIEASWALDALNSVAISGRREESHGAVAAHMEEGHGGLYDLIWGEAQGPARSRTLWLGRPRGIDYRPVLDAFRAELAAPVALWRRRMVLGPAPEFALVVGPKQDLARPQGWTATMVDRACVWPAP